MKHKDVMAHLRAETEPDPQAVARLTRRVSADHAARSPATAPWLAGTAAVVLGAVLFASLSGPFSQDVLPQTLRPSGDAPVVIAPDVQAIIDGQGQVRGTTRDLWIDWESGTLELTLNAPSGVWPSTTTVRIKTAEGDYEARGEATLQLTRDALGSTAAVVTGAVFARCDARSHVQLAPGERHECLPRTAAGLLARARAFERSGAPPTDVLGALALAERAQTADVPAVVSAEIQAAKLPSLLALQDWSTATQAAEEALRIEPRARAEELHRLLASLALRQGSCEAALPHLRALKERTPDEEAHHQRCAKR